jgi:hybrid cluster-associated redox disulfide protein
MAAPTLHTTMADLVGGWPTAQVVLARRGMACIGCSMAAFETVSEAAAAYGFDPHEFIGEVAAACTSPWPNPCRTYGARPRAAHPSSPRKNSR